MRPESVFPRHEAQRLVRGAQHVALLEAGAEQAIDGRRQGLREGLGHAERDLVAHGRPGLEQVDRQDVEGQAVVEQRGGALRVEGRASATAQRRRAGMAASSAAR